MRRWRTYVSKSFKPSAESLRCRQQCTSGCHKHNKFLGREPEGFGKLECWAKLQILRIYPGTSSVIVHPGTIGSPPHRLAYGGESTIDTIPVSQSSLSGLRLRHSVCSQSRQPDTLLPSSAPRRATITVTIFVSGLLCTYAA
jgi:hypothetical protein